MTENDGSESAKGITISRQRAFREIRSHGITEEMTGWEEFSAWMGDRETVSATRVLEWLGY